jgi:hypothetical protein
VLPNASTGQSPGTLAGSWHGARSVWRAFCRPGTNFIEHYECRGTSFIVAAKLSRWLSLGKWAGFVMSRLNCLGSSAKTMTPRAVACSPIDFVSVAGFVRVSEF